MANNVYIGMRYVPKFDGNWNAAKEYEPLMIVQYNSSSYTSKRPVPAGTLPTDTTYWALTGNYNGQIAHLQQELDSVNNDLDTLKGNITAAKLAGKKLNGNLLLNHQFDFTVDGAGNGSCYVGSGRVVTYFSSLDNTNVGILRCYNLTNYSIIWEYPILGYHGNSLTYNPDNQHLYLCAAIDNTNNAAINKIIEIDINYPSSIIREFALPSVTLCYSLTYDSVNEQFYAIAYAGTTAGVADMLYIFNDTLDTLVSSIQLANYPAVTAKLSTQGAQLGINGIVYIPVYDAAGTMIYGYDVTTGNIAGVWALPAYINSCRSIGEVEAFMYDWDRDRYIVASTLQFTGAFKYYSQMFFEVDMFKGIEILKPEPSNDFFGSEQNGKMRSLSCVIAGNTLKPAWLLNKSMVIVPNDALCYSIINNVPISLGFATSNNGVTEQTDTLWGLRLGGFKGVLEGYIGGHTKIHELNIQEQCNVIMRRFELDGFEITGLASGYYANVLLQNMANVFFQNCIFDSYSATGNNKYHIVAYHASTAYSFNNTFNGTVDNNYLANLGGSVIDS